MQPYVDCQHPPRLTQPRQNARLPRPDARQGRRATATAGSARRLPTHSLVLRGERAPSSSGNEIRDDQPSIPLPLYPHSKGLAATASTGCSASAGKPQGSRPIRRDIDPADVFSLLQSSRLCEIPGSGFFPTYNYQKKKSRDRATKLFLFDAAGRTRTFREWLERC